MADRYAAGTAMAGCLYIQGVSEFWESDRLLLWDETDVDIVISQRSGDRKVRTAQELEDALRASAVGLPAIKLWIHETLQEAVRLKLKVG